LSKILSTQSPTFNFTGIALVWQLLTIMAAILEEVQ